MKNFKTKEEALTYCFDNLKPSIVGIDDYNRLRQLKKRYLKNPTSIKENAIQAVFSAFKIKSECKYYIDE
jgi:hypothetical protein